MFNLSISALSIYKGVIIGSQILLAYFGFIIVSVVDKYHYKGIFWGALRGGNIWMSIICCVWISLTLPGIRWLWNVLRHRGLKSSDNGKKLI